MVLLLLQVDKHDPLVCLCCVVLCCVVLCSVALCCILSCVLCLVLCCVSCAFCLVLCCLVCLVFVVVVFVSRCPIVNNYGPAECAERLNSSNRGNKSSK